MSAFQALYPLPIVPVTYNRFRLVSFPSLFQRFFAPVPRYVVSPSSRSFREQQFPSLRRIAEACRPGGEAAARVVDAGCGTGALIPFLKEAGVEEGDVTGVDISPEVRMHNRSAFWDTSLRLWRSWSALCIRARGVPFCSPQVSQLFVCSRSRTRYIKQYVLLKICFSGGLRPRWWRSI